MTYDLPRRGMNDPYGVDDVVNILVSRAEGPGC
jgi:hypothetical protein